MAGLSLQDSLLLAILVGGLLSVVLVLGLLLRRGGRVAVLEAENRRLREELARRK